MAGTLIPIFDIVFGCGIALLAIWIEYRKGSASIEKGLFQLERPGSAGSSLGGIGAALVVSASVSQIGRATGIPGSIFLFIGVTLLIVYSAARKKEVAPSD